MNTFGNWRRGFALATVLVLATAGIAVAQEETGNIFGVVVDGQGDPLPGVTITVQGIGAPRIVQTGSNGEFRLLALDPGSYSLSAELEGFSTVEYPAISVRVTRSTSLQIALSAAVEEVITVTSESPLLDERRVQTGTTITEVELEKIPTARDPWSVLTQTPGVVSDRINVGGNESGQQAVFRGPGVSDDENSFLVDGVEITDMAAIGASPTYYDFDQFSEMQFGTGGSDVSKSAAGVSVNLVTRRGTNEFRGAARYMLTDESLLLWMKQSTPDISSADFGPGQSAISTNSIRRIEDLGFNAGGPVKRDRLWFWGSWGQNDIKQTAAGGTDDDTILENSAFKANVQISGNNSGVASWNNGDKQKFGRGAGPSRSAESTWNQRGPTAVIKFEDTHIFSSNFFLTGQYSKVDGGFSLLARGGGFDASAPETVWDSGGVWQNNFVSGSSSRPAEEFKLDGSYFFTAGNANHELKFGGRMRDFESASAFGWGGRNIVHIAGENFGADPGALDFFFLYRLGAGPVTQEYTSMWLQDTITFGSFTINAGFRYDLQEGANEPGGAPNFSGCDVNTFTGCLPALDFPGNDGGGFDWATISPRVGVTYALGEERKTLLRGSLAVFPEQLSTGNISQTNPLGAAYSYFLFYDGNDNNTWDDVATDGEPIFLFPSGFNPSDPSSITSPNETDSGLDPSITQELVLGVEHAFLPEFVVGFNLTVRETDDILESPDFVTDGSTTRLVTAGDYVADGTVNGTLPGGGSYSEPVFALTPGLSFTGGDLQRNGSRSVDYVGYSVNFTKRLSNRWMMRGYLNFEDTEWSVPAAFKSFDNPTRDESGADTDGGVYAIQSGGSGNKGDVWLQSSWTANVNGLYQVAPDKPWGFNLAANIFAREGYPLPYFHRTTLSDGVSRDILVSSALDSFRAEDVQTVDFRIDKDFAASEDVSLTLSMDIFNALNESFVLQRERQLNGRRADFLDEALSPRIWRLGVRLNWR